MGSDIWDFSVCLQFHLVCSLRINFEVQNQNDASNVGMSELHSMHQRCFFNRRKFNFDSEINMTDTRCWISTSIQHHKLKVRTSVAPPAGWDRSLQPTHWRTKSFQCFHPALSRFFFRCFCAAGRLMQPVWAASCGPFQRSSSSSYSGSFLVCRSSSAPGIFQPAAVSSYRLQKNNKEDF